jgi:uncharacterized protein (TIGR03067 family)
MRAPIRTVLAVPLVLAAVTAGSAGDAKKDQEALQGTWTVTLAEEKGKKSDDDFVKSLRAEIKDDTIKVFKDDKVMVEVKFKLDPGKKPKEVDFTYLSGEDKGQTELGIYEIAGDTAKFCINEKGKTRPKAFATSKDDDLNLIVIQRKKK